MGPTTRRKLKEPDAPLRHGKRMRRRQSFVDQPVFHDVSCLPIPSDPVVALGDGAGWLFCDINQKQVFFIADCLIGPVPGSPTEVSLPDPSHFIRSYPKLSSLR